VSVNETRREEALVEYAELKMKILKDTAILGVGISGALATVDQGVAVSFAMGSVASLAYLQLLTKQVEPACRPLGGGNKTGRFWHVFGGGFGMCLVVEARTAPGGSSRKFWLVLCGPLNGTLNPIGLNPKP
jgi:hypothetical protein